MLAGLGVAELLHAAGVWIRAPLDGEVVGEKLQRHEMHERGEPLAALRHDQHVFGSDVVIRAGSDDRGAEYFE